MPERRSNLADVSVEPSVKKTTAFLAFLLAGVSANAATIVYTVDQAIGLERVAGTIATDGTLGIIGQSNIIGFTLTTGISGTLLVMTDADSVVRTLGSNLVATATDLSFDYDGASGFLLFQHDRFDTGRKYFCNASVFDTCFQGASAVPEAFDSPSAQVETRSRRQIIASTVGAVPEPAAWASMIAGFALIGTAMRRRLVLVDQA